MGATPAKSTGDKAVDDFMAFANMTPAEKMRAVILGNMGLTEAQLRAMDPKERAKIEAKIKKLIEQQIEQSVEKKTGVIIDIKA
jgi:ABC-type lipoprotein release transport system permease subunit